MFKNESRFKEFLIRAKKVTYAGSGELGNSSRPQSKDLHFCAGDFLYIDTYLGEQDFIGQEGVWQNRAAIWGMNYYGRMLVEQVPDGFEHCLKGALQSVPYEAPFRGPEIYRCTGYEYRCNWNGDLNKFSGSEEILLNGTRIYELVFHGGTLKS